MKIDKKQVVIGVATIAIASLIIPTVIWYRDFYTSFHDTVDSEKLSDYATFQVFIISFWGLLLNVILVYIAYKAFENFGVKEQFHIQQLKLVTALATEISSTSLSAMWYVSSQKSNGEAGLSATGLTLSFFEMSQGVDYGKCELLCIKCSSIENIFPFLKYRRNPILPPSIAEQLNRLYRPLKYSSPIQTYPNNYVWFYSKDIEEEDYRKDWVFKFYDQPTDFTEDSKALRTSIIDWLKEYGADNINI